MTLSWGIIFGIISMLGFGFSTAWSKRPVKMMGAMATVFWRGVAISAMLGTILFFFLGQTTFSLKYILIGGLIAIVGYIPLLFFYKALDHGKIGVIAPVTKASLIVTVLLSVIFYQEKLAGMQIWAIVCIAMGVILISINLKDFKNSSLFKLESGLPYAVITCLGWGLVFFLFKIPVMALGAYLAILITEFGQTMLAGINLKINKQSLAWPEKKMWWYIIGVAFGGAIGGIFYNLGISMADVSVVTAITSSSPVIAVLYGKFILREQLRPAQYGAIVLILTGIIMISI